MLKLLIVDDFFYDREDAKEILNWEELSIEVIGAVENGLQALDAISFSQPDILFTDIEMQGINGIELTKIVKERYPNIKVIFMSCYSEFEYARNALKLDVSAYITKPIIKKDVYEVFRHISDKITKEKKSEEEKENLKKRLKDSLPILRERFLRNLFFGERFEESNLWEQVQYLDIFIEKGDFQLILFEIDDYERVKMELSIKEKQLMVMRLSDIINEAKQDIGFSFKTVFTQIDEVHIILMINYYQSEYAQDKEKIGMIFTKKIKELADESNYPSITIVIGNIFNNLMKSCNHYNYCLDAMKYKFFIGKGQLINIDDIPKENKSLNINLNEIKQDIKIVLLSEEEKYIMQFVEKYIDRIYEYSSENSIRNLLYSIVICLQLLMEEFNLNYEIIFSEDLQIWEKLMHIKTILDIRQWVINILIKIKTFIINQNKHKGKKIIETLKKYIEDNLNNELLTVKMIAKEMYFSPNYLNLLFRNNTGETIPDFISRIRVEKAKILLKDPKLKLYEIVEKVGYKHLPYFNTLFRNYAGMTPKEYREYKGDDKL